MKLHEIITALKTPTNSVLIESMIPYKKSLLTYYSDLFCAEPVLMVTMASNAVQYAQIVSSNDFSEAVYWEVENSNPANDEDREIFAEAINANSIMLKDL